MYINEIVADTNISVSVTSPLTQRMMFSTVSVGDLEAKQDVELQKRIRQVSPKAIYCIVKPILYNHAIVTFSNDVVVTVSIFKEGKEYSWYGVNVKTFHLEEGGTFQVIYSSKDSKELNRRSAFRVSIGESATAQIGIGGKPEPMVVKDLSVTGVGLSAKQDSPGKVGDTVKVNFKDSEANKYIDISAMVVRVESPEDANKTLGCSIKACSENLATYLNNKQRSKMHT